MRDALEAGPVVFSGVPGSGRADLARDLEPGRPILELDPLRAGTAEGLRVDLLRDLLDLLERLATASSSTQSFEVLVTQAFGSNAGAALTAAERHDGGSLSLAEILEAIPEQATMVVRDAHLMAEDWARNALWAVRARCQRENALRVVLLTRPWRIDGLVGPDAPFFGFARVFDFADSDLAQWTDGLRGALPPGDLEWLVIQTRGLPRPTLAVLERVRGESSDVRSAWAAEVAAARPSAWWVVRLARGLHLYGPRLICAIAANEPVYPSVPGARSDAVAAALKTMRDHDLIYQPAPRRWVIADPARRCRAPSRARARTCSAPSGRGSRCRWRRARCRRSRRRPGP